jgi:hypothetical protein
VVPGQDQQKVKAYGIVNRIASLQKVNVAEAPGDL